ncbi:hypothetical protein NC651_038526 [Populus alba x Populus x berolinensis]|nr:hypothetical protein NC651_038526 [Populus alba x Populus x berolinensis]
MLDHQYKLFKILPNESITSMFARMITITNSLDGLGRTYTTITMEKQEQGEKPKKTLNSKPFIILMMMMTTT